MIATPQVILLNSSDQQQTGKSGYPAIIPYLDCAEELQVPRRSSAGLLSRCMRKLIRRVAATSWVELSSAMLELAAIRNWKQSNIAHVLWADRDWCLIDRVPRPAGLRLIGTFHACDDDFDRVIRSPKRLRQFAAVILMSETQKKNFVEAGVDEDRVHVIPHGIDTQHFRPDRQLPETDIFRVLHVGNYRRNFDDLFDVCSALQARPDIRFQLLASESTASRFRELPNVEILPRLSDAELLSAYQAASCLLMTATGATANNAILEAMACGLPVISQRVGGIPEYVVPDCSLLSEPGDSNSLAKSVETLADDEHTARKLGEAARNRALELDWKIVAAGTLDVYAKALENARP